MSWSFLKGCGLLWNVLKSRFLYCSLVWDVTHTKRKFRRFPKSLLALTKEQEGKTIFRDLVDCECMCLRCEAWLLTITIRTNFFVNMYNQLFLCQMFYNTLTTKTFALKAFNKILMHHCWSDYVLGLHSAASPGNLTGPINKVIFSYRKLQKKFPQKHLRN